MEKIHPIYKDDLRIGPFKDDKLQRVLPQYRDQLEEEIKDVFIWAIGQSALTEMTKTVREKEPTSLPLYRLCMYHSMHCSDYILSPSGTNTIAP